MLSAMEFEAACVCYGLRRAARRISKRYEAALRPVGLTPGQFSILAALQRPKPARITPLAELLGMDRTTLTRDLKPLERRGLVTSVPDDDDARVRRLVLTSDGRALLDEALPLWSRAQAQARERLGNRNWAELRSVLDQLAA